jgi:hypothetical protein
MVADRESNKNNHSIFSISIVTQLSGNKTKQDDAVSTTSKKTKHAIKKLKKITKIEIMDAPSVPIKRPKLSKTREEINGKKIKSKYIF